MEVFFFFLVIQSMIWKKHWNLSRFISFLKHHFNNQHRRINKNTKGNIYPKIYSILIKSMEATWYNKDRAVISLSPKKMMCLKADIFPSVSILTEEKTKIYNDKFLCNDVCRILNANYSEISRRPITDGNSKF